MTKRAQESPVVAYIDTSQLRHRPIGPGEIARLRAIFWNLAALGHRLPAERGVIVIKGGRER